MRGKLRCCMPGMHDETAECFLHDGREPMECGQLLVDVQCRLLEIKHHMPGMHDEAAQCFLHDGREPGECRQLLVDLQCRLLEIRISCLLCRVQRSLLERWRKTYLCQERNTVLRATGVWDQPGACFVYRHHTRRL